MEIQYRPPDRSKYLLDDELALLYKAAKCWKTQWWYYLLYFYGETGARPTEGLAVTRKQFNDAYGIVTVATIKQKKRKKKKLIDGVETIVEVDAKRPPRDIDLSKEAYATLKPFLDTKEPDERLFGCTRQWEWQLFKRAAREAGLSASYTLYSLRHSRCIHLLRVTKRATGAYDYGYVQKQMGHSNVNITMSYVHVVPEEREKYRNML